MTFKTQSSVSLYKTGKHDAHTIEFDSYVFEMWLRLDDE